jgi:hypothetical protein
MNWLFYFCQNNSLNMNNKRILNLVLFVATLTFAFACAKKGEDHDHEHSTEAVASEAEWKEMDDFHVIMADAFHPFKDSANLEPVKTHAEHLATEAEKWAATTLPEKVNNDTVRAKLEKLKTDTRALADKIKAGGTDEEVASQLTAVHDLFHEIQEAWYSGGHKEHH